MAHEIGRLHLACANGHVDIVRKILDKGDSVHSTGNHGVTPLFMAAFHGRYKVVQLLLERGALVDMPNNDDTGKFALLAASKQGHFQVVQLLLDRGAKVNKQTPDGFSALMAASLNGHCDVMELLLSKGANVNMQDSNGISSLMIASEAGHCKAAALLIENGAEMDFQASHHGGFALLAASQGGHCDIVRLLATKGAKMDMQAHHGGTPITVALSEGKKEAAMLLIELGADTSIRDDSGRDAMDWACVKGYDDIVSRILDTSIGGSATPVTTPGNLPSPPKAMPPQTEPEPTCEENPPAATVKPSTNTDGESAIPVPAPEEKPSSQKVTPQFTSEANLTIEDLKMKYDVSDEQLDTMITEEDLYDLAGAFRHHEVYLPKLGLNPAQQTDIDDLVHKKGTQIAMAKALRMWRMPNPLAATFKTLIEILLELKSGDVAIRVCEYLKKEVQKTQL